jgi:hypothetical protein
MNNNSAHRAAMAKAVRVGADTFNAEVYKSMRNPLSAATYGVRPWPEHLTPERGFMDCLQRQLQHTSGSA